MKKNGWQYLQTLLKIAFKISSNCKPLVCDEEHYFFSWLFKKNVYNVVTVLGHLSLLLSETRDLWDHNVCNQSILVKSG